MKSRVLFSAVKQSRKECVYIKAPSTTSDPFQCHPQPGVEVSNVCGRRCEVRGCSGVLSYHLAWVLDTGGADGVAMGGCEVLFRGTEAAEEEMSSA